MAIRRNVMSWVGVLASGAVLLALSVLFVATGLDSADKLASVIGAFVGVAGLGGSLYGLALARRSRDSPPPPAVAGNDFVAPRPLPEATRLRVPFGMAALPRPASRVFVGREKELVQLEEAFGDTARLTVQVVCGLGGVGKSELALQYVDSRRGRYPLIWWIDSAAPETLLTGLADLARGIASGSASSAAGRVTNEEAVSWVIAWLAAHPGWLLVFDNATEAVSLRPYLGRLHGGHVLITTRRTVGWNDLCSPIILEVLSRQAAVRLLAELTRSPDTEELDALAGELGDLPLALAQAGAYVAHTPGIGVRRYRELLRTSPKRMYASAAPGDDPERLVAKVWAVTRARVEEISPLAIDLLNLLACFAADDLPRDVLIRAVGAEEVNAAEAMGVLSSYSMIGLVDDGISVHRLVQAVTLHELDDRQRSTLRARAAESLVEILPDRPADPSNWPLYARLLPHVMVLLHAGSPGLSRTVDYLDAIADYATAVRLQQRVVDAACERAGAEHRSALTARARLARFTGMAGDAAGARDQYTRLRPLFERHFGPTHEQTLTLRVRLAEWTGEAGDRSDARGEYTRLIPLLDKVLGQEHPQTLYARMDFANWIGHLGDAATAYEVSAPLLPIAERVWGPEHPHTLTLRGCLAHFTGHIGDAAGARDQYAALLSLRRRYNGPDHPETLATSRDLATWIGEAGDPQQARDRLGELIPLFERTWGKEHPNETLVARGLHAEFTGCAGDPVAARRLLAELLPIRERVSGADHPLTRTTRAALARWTQEIRSP
ncbi:FxSxx-COOH system tetratricopeptide repeat protein [Nonomuraea sp. NPDC049709]|uniref:FxSxx-COOH system tetratricopeptide repeat protein n=1 Tax=Nonomuraea sp. NPDC049709 TaxID=3154736 RepID=UPI00343F5A31